jgi:hypothetical protein
MKTLERRGMIYLKRSDQEMSPNGLGQVFLPQLYCPGSWASSRASFVPSSRASSPVSWAASDAGSRPPSAMSNTFHDLGDDELPPLTVS